MSIRTERVGKLLQRELADIFISEFGEQLQPMMTVTGTRVTKDLSIAYVDVSVMGSTQEQRQAAFNHLKGLTTEIRTALAQRIRHQLRKVPELKFFLDETLQNAQRMEQLFDQIRDERAQRDDES